jgi:hypothetical protein
MKRHILLSLLLLLTVGASTFVLKQVSAQKDDESGNTAMRPESTAPQTLPFTQNWSNAGLITANDDWSSVPGIEGYLGQDITLATGVDPQTLLTTSTVTTAPDLDVVANQAAPETNTSGGVGEFDGISNPTVALQGSGTADAPYIIIYLNTTGRSNINVAYNLRDIDGSTDNSTQPVALQYRVGSTGDFTNLPAGFVADASTGPNLATQVTPVSVQLPANANNQALVQVRVITTNAVGSDEWIGVDDINITGTVAGGSPTPTATATPAASPTPSPTATATPSGSPTPALGTLPKRLFTARMSGLQEVPANNSPGRGFGRVVLNAAETQITASFYFENLSANTISGHIHSPALPGANAPVLFDMSPPLGVTRGQAVDRTFNVTPAQVADLRAGLWYFNVHTTAFTGGEIRGQIGTANDAPADFNGDGKTDFGVIRKTGGAAGQGQTRWFILTNSTPQVETQVDFGVDTDAVTPADFDGDGKDDIAVWRAEANNSKYFILQSSTNTLRTVRFGIPNDDPYIVQDYDGDGIDDPAIFRKPDALGAQAFFWWLGSYGATKNVEVPIRWGSSGDGTTANGVGDIAYPGDFNGDGKADFVVYRNTGTTPNRGVFLIHYGTGGFDAPSTNDASVRFGLAADVVVPGDWDGDGATDFGISRFEGANLFWYVMRMSNQTTYSKQPWGRVGDTEVQGDYDGDGKTDYAIWRASGTDPKGVFYILRSADNTAQYQQWGFLDEVPAAVDAHQ